MNNATIDCGCKFGTGNNLSVRLKIKTALPAHIDLDVNAYLLNAQNKVRGDADMIFMDRNTL